MISRVVNLKVKGNGLIFSEPDVLSIITLAMSAMLSNCDKKKKVKGESFEGMIITNFNKGSFGYVSGVIFDVALDSDYGTSSMECILRRPVIAEELEGITWIPFPGDITSDQIKEFIDEITRENPVNIQ